jgi:hypothetical protein
MRGQKSILKNAEGGNTVGIFAPANIALASHVVGVFISTKGRNRLANIAH